VNDLMSSQLNQYKDTFLNQLKINLISLKSTQFWRLNFFDELVKSLSLNFFKKQIHLLLNLNWVYVLNDMRFDFLLVMNFLQITDFSLDIFFLSYINFIKFNLFIWVLLNFYFFDNTREVVIKWNCISYFSLTSLAKHMYRVYEFSVLSFQFLRFILIFNVI